MLVQKNSRPLYEQLKQTLVRDIIAGKYKEGERLPGEFSLVQTYGISRVTVRRAIAEMIKEGYLSSQRGRGTFVSYKKEANRLISFAGFQEKEEDKRPKQTSSRILSKEIVLAEGSVAHNLKVPEGSELIRLHRLLSEDGRPYMIDTAYFIVDRYPGLFKLLVDDVSTFALLKRRYKIEFAKAKKVLGVVRASDEEAMLLQCVPGDPLFSVSKVIYDRADVPIHYSHYLVLGDRCVYALTVTSEMMNLQTRRDKSTSDDLIEGC
jgi:GntR family frlABCD operon transcriptional regulator